MIVWMASTRYNLILICHYIYMYNCIQMNTLEVDEIVIPEACAEFESQETITTSVMVCLDDICKDLIMIEFSIFLIINVLISVTNL